MTNERENTIRKGPRVVVSEGQGGKGYRRGKDKGGRIIIYFQM